MILDINFLYQKLVEISNISITQISFELNIHFDICCYKRLLTEI